MEISYINTPEDLKPFMIAERMKSPEWNREVKSTKNLYYFMGGAMLVYALYCLFRYFVIYKADKEQIGLIGNAISVGISGVFIILMQFIVLPLKKTFLNWEIKRDLKQITSDERDRVTISISDKGINWKLGKKSGTQKMTEHFDVVENPDSYFLYLKKEVFVIPRRAFEYEEEMQFRKLLRLDRE